MPTTPRRHYGYRFTLSAIALAITATLAACSGGDSNDDGSVIIPAPPQGLGVVDIATAGIATVPAGRTDIPAHRIDAAVSKDQKGKIDPVTGYALNNAGYPSGSDDACYADANTNLSIRALKEFLKIWSPVTPFMDAYQRDIPASQVTTKEGVTFQCPAIPMTTWSGIPGDGTDGTVLNPTIHQANLEYSGKVTSDSYRDEQKALAAYLDDARGKNYSVSLGLGPLAASWHALAKQSSYIDAIPEGAEGVCPDGKPGKYPFCSAPEDEKYNIGEGASHDAATATANNPDFGLAVNFVMRATNDGTASTNAPKYFYKYARPYRWYDAHLTDIKITVSPGLENARKIPENSSANDIRKDSDFPSGHTAEGVRGGFAYGYLVPQRFQEMIARGMELGENRIVAGMHSALAVMGGRISGETAALNLINRIPANERAAAYAQAQEKLRNAAAAQAGAQAATDEGFMAFAHSQMNAQEVAPFVTPLASHDENKREYRRRMTFGFAQDLSKAGKPAVVPVGAETLLETRLPYLTAEQRRTVLKTTAIDSGYPVLDDEEGFGRLNYFDAADGYGNFNDGDVEVTMDAALGGFHAQDAWRNDISGAGKLTKLGTGSLALTGNNTFFGGLVISGGSIVAASTHALGQGMVYLDNTGTLDIPSDATAQAPVEIANQLVLTGTSKLQVALHSANFAPVNVAQKVLLDKDSSLTVSLPENAAKGTVYPVIEAGTLAGRFAKIDLPEGVKATPIYSVSGLSLRID